MSRFTPGELKVMRLLWEHGELKPAELQERFPEPIKNPALRSYLTTLLEKGHVTRRRVGKAYYYKAVTRSRSAFRTMLGELVDVYCGGSVQALVMNIIKSERLSEDELLELKRLADDGDSTSPPQTRGAENEPVRVLVRVLRGPGGRLDRARPGRQVDRRAGPGLAGAWDARAPEPPLASRALAIDRRRPRAGGGPLIGSSDRDVSPRSPGIRLDRSRANGLRTALAEESRASRRP